jgi:NAD(P)-dependent dehydrogenase (short-subunit alcohol dehydrogenase family)
MTDGMFAGRLAIVTGGGSGIGRAVGEALAQRGAHVWFADVDGAAAEQAARGAAGPGSARGITLDVTDAAAVRAVVDAACAEGGRLDYLFNNAGIALFGDARHMTLADWNDLIRVNIQGVVHGVVAAYPRMVEQGGGHIVNTASAAGLLPVPYNTAYAATKHAVVGLSTSLRIEAERHGVRVSAVCPGLIDTPLKQSMKVLGVTREEVLADSPPLFPAERCAQVILRGVERNRDLIVVTPVAQILWRLYRFVPRPTRALIAYMARRTPFAR